MSSSKETTSALMKPRWKSEWMTPAASGAVAPAGMVQARDLLRAGREICLQAQGREADPGQLVQAGLGLPGGLQQLQRASASSSSIELGLDLRVEQDRLRRGHQGAQFGQERRRPSSSESRLNT